MVCNFASLQRSDTLPGQKPKQLQKVRALFCKNVLFHEIFSFFFQKKNLLYWAAIANSRFLHTKVCTLIVDTSSERPMGSKYLWSRIYVMHLQFYEIYFLNWNLAKTERWNFTGYSSPHWFFVLSIEESHVTRSD